MMATSKKGKTNAKKATTKKKAATKTTAKKAGAKTATKKSVVKKAPIKKVEESKIVTPAKGDIVVAFSKHYRVHAVATRNGTVTGIPLPMVECGMKGANFYREIQWTQITAIYKDAGYRG